MAEGKTRLNPDYRGANVLPLQWHLRAVRVAAAEKLWWTRHALTSEPQRRALLESLYHRQRAETPEGASQPGLWRHSGTGRGLVVVHLKSKTSKKTNLHFDTYPCLPPCFTAPTIAGPFGMMEGQQERCSSRGKPAAPTSAPSRVLL